MSEGTSIDLGKAKQGFIQLMRSLNKTDQQTFLTFIVKEWGLEALVPHDCAEGDVCSGGKAMDDAAFILNSIAWDIKQKIPFNAVLPSEKITTPSSGENSNCHTDVTLHVDTFLYDDEEVDELADNEQLQRYYCVDCGSKRICPLIFLSHSMSRDELYYIFIELLPILKGKTVLDVGSRLGAVLYGAYVYTDAKRIIGVEMNEEYCHLQNNIIHKYQMDNRISVLHNRIEKIPEIVQESDVIIMNNPFEFYLSEAAQIDIWRYLKATVKQGTILVTRPSMERIFKTLQIAISVKEWLRPFKDPYSNKFPALSSMNNTEHPDITCYKVL